MEIVSVVLSDSTEGNSGEGSSGEEMNGIGVCHQIKVTQLPTRIPQVNLAMEFVRAPQEKGRMAFIRIALLNPQEKEIMGARGELGQRGSTKPLESVMISVATFSDVEFLQAGSHRVDIYVNEVRRESVPFEIVLPELSG